MKKSKDMQFWAYLFDNHEIRPVGWFDMSDWHDGFEKVMDEANKIAKQYETEIAFPLKGEYLDCYIEDIKWCMKVMDDTNEDNK